MTSINGLHGCLSIAKNRHNTTMTNKKTKAKPIKAKPEASSKTKRENDSIIEAINNENHLVVAVQQERDGVSVCLGGSTNSNFVDTLHLAFSLKQGADKLVDQVLESLGEKGPIEGEDLRDMFESICKKAKKDGYEPSETKHYDKGGFDFSFSMS